MKKIISISVIALIISFQGISQSRQADSIEILKYNHKVIGNAIEELISDPDLNKPYFVTTNHKDFRGKGMDMIKNNQDSFFIKISQLPSFSGVLIEDEYGHVEETMDTSLIAKNINELQSQITNSISSSPTRIYESYFFGDSTHIEYWYFKNKKGEDSEFSITFTNGQITVLYFKI